MDKVDLGDYQTARREVPAMRQVAAIRAAGFVGADGGPTHSSGRTTDIYIKESVPELSDLSLALARMASNI